MGGGARHAAVPGATRGDRPARIRPRQLPRPRGLRPEGELTPSAPTRDEVLGLYRGEAAGTRIHVAGRWWSCPFEAVAAAVPHSGRVLELGCGHGLMSVLLALGPAQRDVLGTDVDGGKIAAAGRAAQLTPGTVRFEAVDPGRLPAGPWNAIVIVDVLYLIERESQRALIEDAARALAPGGVLVVKEMSPHPRWKAAWMRLQERLAVRILRITEGDDLDWVAPNELARWMGDAGLLVEHRPMDRGYVHPHHLVVGRRAGP